MSRRNFLFTSYKTDTNFDFAEHESVKYAIWQKERCPTTKRLHWQGYIEFNKTVRVPEVRRVLNDPGVHCEARRGEREDAKEYCSKEDTRVEGPFEYGVFDEGGQGKRSDIRAKAQIIKDFHRENPKTTLQRLAQEHPEIILQYARGVTTLIGALDNKKRNEETKCLLILGPPGVGKSYWVGKNFPDAYWKPRSTEAWWDGYEGDETVVIDEFKGWIQHSVITQLIGNSNPTKVNIKGGTKEFLAKRVIIISNFSPREWYDNQKTSLPALLRRFSQVLYFRAKHPVFDDDGQPLRDSEGNQVFTNEIEEYQSFSDFEDIHPEVQYI